MPHDPLLIAETKSWFVKAANDLRAAEHEFTAQPPLLGDIVFHCQQAAEKAMKGFLTWHNQPYHKTHSLEQIGEQCLVLDPSLKPFVDGDVVIRLCLQTVALDFGSNVAMLLMRLSLIISR